MLANLYVLERALQPQLESRQAQRNAAARLAGVETGASGTARLWQAGRRMFTHTTR